MRGGCSHSPSLLRPLWSSSSRLLGRSFSEAGASRSTTEPTFRPTSRGLTVTASIALGSWLVRYHAGGGSLRTFGSHRIRHATATLLVNNGMPLEEVSRYLGHSSTDVTRR